MTCLVMHSGGLDSTILANELKKSGENPKSVYINFGNIDSNLELDAFRLSASYIDLSMHVIDASSISSSHNSSALRGGDDVCMPNPGENVAPLGSFLFYGIIFPYAIRCGYNKIYVGLTKQDAEFRPEFTKEFSDKLSDLSEFAGFGRISIEVPFIEKDKSEIVNLGTEKLFELSRSCIHSSGEHCGVCSGCRSRRIAFEKSAFDDLTKYRH